MANKRSNGEGTIDKVIRSGYSYWRCRYTVSNASGKQNQKAKYFKTQKEAREYLQSVSVELNNDTYLEPSKQTVSQWLDTWLKDYCNEQKYSTVKHYKAQCETHIKPALGAIKLCDLRPQQIQSFYNELAKTGKITTKKDKSGKTVTTRSPLASKTIKNIHAVFSKALSIAVELDYIKTNPASKTSIKRPVRKEIHPLTDEQAKLFMKNIGNDKYSNILRVILYSGLRESEAIGLTWDSVDFKNNVLKIDKQLQRRPQADGGYTFTPPKNNKTRYITVAPFVMQILKDQQKKQLEEKNKCPADIWQGYKDSKEQKTALVFTDELGSNLHPKLLYQRYKRIAKKIGAEDTTVHDLRHTFAVFSLQNGDDYKTVQENLGHASASFTLDIYGHVSEKMKQASADRMQAHIMELMSGS